MLIDGNDNKDDNPMLECIDGLTGIPLSLTGSNPFNFLIDAIYNSAIGTLADEKVTLNHLPQNVLPVAHSLNFARGSSLICTLSLLSQLLRFNPVNNKDKLCGIVTALINAGIAACLLGKSKKPLKQRDAFRKKLPEGRTQAIETAASLSRNAQMNELLENTYLEQSITLNRDGSSRQDYATHWQQDRQKKHDWTYLAGPKAEVQSYDKYYVLLNRCLRAIVRH
jgi:hypothetical protein